MSTYTYTEPTTDQVVVSLDVTEGFDLASTVTYQVMLAAQQELFVLFDETIEIFGVSGTELAVSFATSGGIRSRDYLWAFMDDAYNVVSRSLSDVVGVRVTVKGALPADVTRPGLTICIEG